MPATEKAEREAPAFLAHCDAAGRFADFHSLRHTFVSDLARAGARPKALPRLARHASIETTRAHYAHVTQDDDAAALAARPSLDSDRGANRGAREAG